MSDNRLFFNSPKGISKLTLVTDAWHPQVNGVVTTLTHLVAELRKMGIQIDVIQPNDYPNLPLPTYPEIRWVRRAKGLEDRIMSFQPDALYIATEGALGWKSRRIARKHGLPFTTGYHTKYPEYIHKRFSWIPIPWVYRVLRYFHNAAQKTLVPTESLQQELLTKGFHHVGIMSRGVNTDLFNPSRQSDLGYTPPIYLSVGRVAPEKNLEAFLDLNLPGTKIVVGQGPDLEKLSIAYPSVQFVGPLKGEELARHYASADVFVFPSVTDTFGVVNIEAIACGTPVAAYPVTGPKDIVKPGINGALNKDLKEAIEEALTLDRTPIAQSIPEYSWETAAKQFLGHMSPIPKASPPKLNTAQVKPH